MIHKITILRNIRPIVREEIESFEGEDFTMLTFAQEMDGSALIFTVYVTYAILRPGAALKTDIAKYQVTYKVEIDGGSITSESLYPTCRTTVSTLVELLRFPAQWRKIPRNRIVCPPLKDVEKALQGVVNWYVAKLN